MCPLDGDDDHDDGADRPWWWTRGCCWLADHWSRNLAVAVGAAVVVAAAGSSQLA